MRRRWPLYVVTCLLVAELLSLGVGGTFASYTSETNNPSSNVATGTLTLATTSNSVTCNSYTAADNSNSGCGAMTIATGPFYPGQTGTASITVKNSGSLPGKLSVFSLAGCTTSTVLCGEVEFYVQVTTSGGTTCYYPTVSTGNCSFSSTGTMANFANNTYYDSADALSLGSIAAVTSDTVQLGFYLPTFSSPSTGNQYQGLNAKMDLSWFLSQG